MRSQDDITLASQQFAGQVADRRNDIANRQIDLNLQAGQMSRQAMESWQSGGRYAAEQAESAVNLTGAELRIQQAREELDWARQIHDVNARANFIARDRAQTALLIAQSKKQIRELDDYQPEYATNLLSRAGLIASGVKPTYNHATGGWDFQESTPDEQKESQDYYLSARTRGSRGPVDPNVAVNRDLDMRRKLLDLANEAYDRDDKARGDYWTKQAGIVPQDGEAKKPEPLPPQWNIPQLGESNSRAVMGAVEENMDVLRESFAKNERAFSDAGRRQPNDDEIRSWVAGEMRNVKSPIRKIMLAWIEADGRLNRSEMDMKSELDGNATTGASPFGGMTIPQVRR